MSATFRILQVDITQLAVDVIVSSIGSKVGDAVLRCGGPSIELELDRARPATSIIVTGPGLLHARCIFHVTAPVYVDGEHGEFQQLTACYRACLNLAESSGFSSIAFPSLATGKGGFLAAEAAQIAIREIAAHCNTPASKIIEVTAALVNPATYRIYQILLTPSS